MPVLRARVLSPRAYRRGVYVVVFFCKPQHPRRRTRPASAREVCPHPCISVAPLTFSAAVGRDLFAKSRHENAERSPSSVPTSPPNSSFSTTASSSTPPSNKPIPLSSPRPVSRCRHAEVYSFDACCAHAAPRTHQHSRTKSYTQPHTHSHSSTRGTNPHDSKCTHTAMHTHSETHRDTLTETHGLGQPHINTNTSTHTPTPTVRA